ncbi:MAG: hypothetical protein K1X88_34695 [Nannocystaceae bacterium]|nr:hypothetical protein [Nannocystaceae bacterium]
MARVWGRQRRTWWAATVAMTACSAGALPESGSGYFGTTLPMTTAGMTATTGEDTGDDASAEAGATSDGGGSSTAAPGDSSGGASVGESGNPTCGDGVRDPDEACDGMDFGGDDCSAYGFDEGVLACDEECHAITDACSTCGDGEVSLGEACEVGDFGGATCQSMGYGGGALLCEADCKSIGTDGCTALPSCGDGVRNGGEQCDGNDVGAATCVSQGFDLGNIGCTAACTLDVTGCMDDLTNCGMMGDFCFFDENDPQSTCCPAGVGGNVLGICDIFLCV